MKILVDTCVWSEALHRKTSEESDVSREHRGLILEHRVEIIGPIRQELLSGLREDAQFDRLEEYLEAADHVTAAKYFNKCRANGIQGSTLIF